MGDIGHVWRGGERFSPQMAADERERLLAGWRRAVAAARRHGEAAPAG